MIRIGVVGAGHLGKIHLKLLSTNPNFKLIGFSDTDREASLKLANENGYQFFDEPSLLFKEVEAVCIVTPTPTHYLIAKSALESGLHVLIEKPITSNLKDAIELVELSAKHNCVGVVGHVERFNPAYASAKTYVNSPKFIEIHRLAEFNPRGNDVSVVLDLMIHDIDILLQLVQSPIASIQANGASVVSTTPDIASARIAFEDGCVANLTASRISLKNMRRTRIFQQDAYITLDFLAKKTEVVRIKDAPKNPEPFDMILQTSEGIQKQIYFETPKAVEVNAIEEEHTDFAKAIRENTPPTVSLAHGAKALEVAQSIIEKL